MKRLIFPITAVAALIFVGGARADTDPSTPVLASPGSSPFGACTADLPDLQQQLLGSTLYPNTEIEPRSTRHGSNIVAEYQQDRWSDGGARGLVTSVSHDDGATWHRVVVPGVSACSGAPSSAPRTPGFRSRRTAISMRSP
jgi:hypothetical protein